MTIRWHIEPQWRDAFPSLESAVGATGQVINANWMSRLVLADHADTRFYVKVYASRGRWLRRFLGRSRIRAEWENVQTFSRLEVPTAELVAFGEGRVDGAYAGVMITREVRGTRDLAALVREDHPRLGDRNWRLVVIRRLSHAVRNLHQAGFIHNDLKWRNILVALDENPAIYLIDCPQGRFCRGSMLTRGLVKDMACLDKIGRTSLSRADRLRFYLAVRGLDRLNPRSKKEVRQILGFFSGRR